MAVTIAGEAPLGEPSTDLDRAARSSSLFVNVARKANEVSRYRFLSSRFLLVSCPAAKIADRPYLLWKQLSYLKKKVLSLLKST